MNSHSPAYPKLTIFLLLAAIVALLAASAGLLATGASAAGSGGGISLDEDGKADSGEKKSTAKSGKYNRLWKKASNRDKRWARRTSECESGGDPDAIGGGGKYRGAFQFLKSTWRAAPKSPGGDPIRYAYKTQAVVAIALKRSDGRGHWPNCG